LTSSGPGRSTSSTTTDRRRESAVPKPLIPNPLFLSWSAVLTWHRERYPLLRAQDIYKLIHQSAFGPGHIIAGAVQARRMLREEMAALEVRSQEAKAKRQDPDEELLEAIEPGGRLVRVNLRPMLRMRDEGGKRKGRDGGADAEWLTNALVESARRVRGNPEQMRRRLSAAVRWCRENLPRQAAELERMAARAEESGYPAFHHSPAYSRAYRPAYRVILSDCLNSRVSGRAR
jgi:hypothetical protein